MSEAKRATVEDAEDDFDEFDDVLSQFNTANKTSPSVSPLTSPPPPPPTATTTFYGRPRTNTLVDLPPKSIPGSTKTALSSMAEDVDENELTAEFTRELAKGMENLMKELQEEAGHPESEGGTEEERTRLMKAAWEAMLVEGMNGEGGEDIQQMMGPDYKPKDAGSGGDFQSKIKQTMNKLKQSESDLKAEGSTSASDPDLAGIEALLKDLGMGENGGLDASEETIDGFFEKMMGQLMSKEVLYEPLKELSDKFPGFLANPPADLTSEDKQRYQTQMACVQKIVAVFEAPGYDDKNAADMKKVVDLMSEMQSYGAPPESIMGPLPPGLGFGPDGLPQMGEGCVVM
ncbi:Pex19 protein family-domain-containing protein [Desarmillaria tabescens]|uniref:Pex19 protein family-domain-containing protein n=1 Tax=Armillaria tabescens TaxID=1929756 RepID=A0AA39N4B7_ARMTA|nr:Pex19 protein family-domain-containing protein [Desarmillaria tabescens]KAK0457681.1 Pex19 protein family-domain-containing protein [Desarmillaria tabescens]